MEIQGLLEAVQIWKEELKYAPVDSGVLCVITFGHKWTQTLSADN